MNLPKHSPAPFIVKESVYGIQELWSARDDEGYMTCIATIYNSGPETKPYNQLLFRHAPDLLAAIKEVLALIGQDKIRPMSDEEHLELARRLGGAVNRAEGRPS